jgi:ABC-type thiamine transport system ATPase subunit
MNSITQKQTPESKKQNVVELKVGRLTVTEELPNRMSGNYTKRFALCKCECDNTKEIIPELVNLNKSNTISWGFY